MVTIKDVAMLTGVSVATVSNYINNTKNVSDSVAERIEQAITKLGYVHNKLAGNLKSGTGNLIGVILPNITDSYYVRIFEGIENYFEEKGMSVTLKITKDLRELEHKFVLDLLEYKVAGVIAVTSLVDKADFFNEMFLKRNVPFVHIDRKIDGLDADFFAFDNQKAIKELTSHLIKNGKKNIAVFTGPIDYSSEKDAVEGFYDAISESKPHINHMVLHTFLSKEAAFRTTVQYLHKFNPDAVITTSKLILSGVIEALSVTGLNIQTATLSEDNWNALSDYPGTLSVPRKAIMLGDEAAGCLYSQIKQNDHLVTDTIFDLDFQATNNQIYYKAKNNISLEILMLDTLQVDLYNSLIPHFTSKTGTYVNIKKVPHKNMLQALYNDKTCDVVMFDMPWLFSLAKDNILADITDKINSPEFNKEIYLDNCLNHYGMFEDKFYALPFMYAPQILYYRKDLFENKYYQNEYRKKFDSKLRVPKNWIEFNKTASFFTKSINSKSPTEYGTAISAAYVECLMPEIYMRMRAYGSTIFSDDFRVTFYSKNTIRAYENFAQLISIISKDCLVYDDTTVVDEFIKGNLAMLITYPSFISNVNDLQRSCLTGNVGFDHIPGKYPILGGWSLGVSNFSNKKDEAFMFVDWACGEDMSSYKTLMAGQSTVKKGFENNELVTFYPWLPLYKSVYNYSEPLVPPYKNGKKIIPQAKIDKIISNDVYSMLHGEISPKDAVYQSHLELKRLFNIYQY